MRANKINLRIKKADLMNCWKMTEEQWGQLKELALKRSWEEFHTRGHHTSFAQRDYLEAINKVINGFGVESLHPCVADCQYVNMGDTYAWTIIIYKGKLYLGCWGDYVEFYCTCEKEESA